MTLEEFVGAMRTTLDYSQVIGKVIAGGNSKSSEAIFYLAALRSIEREPFDTGRGQQELIDFVHARLNEALGGLSTEEVEGVFLALENLDHQES